MSRLELEWVGRERDKDGNELLPLPSQSQISNIEACSRVTGSRVWQSTMLYSISTLGHTQLVK